MNRIFLFILTNVAVLVVLSVVMRLFGVEPYLTAYGLNYESLLIFSAVIGMAVRHSIDSAKRVIDVFDNRVAKRILDTFEEILRVVEKRCR